METPSWVPRFTEYRAKAVLLEKYFRTSHNENSPEYIAKAIELRECYSNLFNLWTLYVERPSEGTMFNDHVSLCLTLLIGLYCDHIKGKKFFKYTNEDIAKKSAIEFAKRAQTGNIIQQTRQNIRPLIESVTVNKDSINIQLPDLGEKDEDKQKNLKDTSGKYDGILGDHATLYNSMRAFLDTFKNEIKCIKGDETALVEYTEEANNVVEITIKKFLQLRKQILSKYDLTSNIFDTCRYNTTNKGSEYITLVEDIQKIVQIIHILDVINDMAKRKSKAIEKYEDALINGKWESDNINLLIAVTEMQAGIDTYTDEEFKGKIEEMRQKIQEEYPSYTELVNIMMNKDKDKIVKVLRSIDTNNLVETVTESSKALGKFCDIATVFHELTFSPPILKKGAQNSQEETNNMFVFYANFIDSNAHIEYIDNLLGYKLLPSEDTLQSNEESGQPSKKKPKNLPSQKINGKPSRFERFQGMVAGIMQNCDTNISNLKKRNGHRRNLLALIPETKAEYIKEKTILDSTEKLVSMFEISSELYKEYNSYLTSGDIANQQRIMERLFYLHMIKQYFEQKMDFDCFTNYSRNIVYKSATAYTRQNKYIYKYYKTFTEHDIKHKHEMMIFKLPSKYITMMENDISNKLSKIKNGVPNAPLLEKEVETTKELYFHLTGKTADRNTLILQIEEVRRDLKQREKTEQESQASITELSTEISSLTSKMHKLPEGDAERIDIEKQIESLKAKKLAINPEKSRKELQSELARRKDLLSKIEPWTLKVNPSKA